MVNAYAVLGWLSRKQHADRHQSRLVASNIGLISVEAVVANSEGHATSKK